MPVEVLLLLQTAIKTTTLQKQHCCNNTLYHYFMHYRTAIRILLAILFPVIVFHLLVVAKAIPYSIVWGGQLQNDAAMYVMECCSISINLLLVFLLLMKGAYLPAWLKPKIVHRFLWVFLILFVLNTVGNLFANTLLEKSLAVLTLASAVLLWFIVRPKTPNNNEPTAAE